MSIPKRPKKNGGNENWHYKLPVDNLHNRKSVQKNKNTKSINGIFIFWQLYNYIWILVSMLKNGCKKTLRVVLHIMLHPKMRNFDKNADLVTGNIPFLNFDSMFEEREKLWQENGKN